ncbi:hypothetical protein SASPL_118211 [Salvia splendens]|uniref:AC transposase n=1 Tax=Salvia splendens TaxID=180675 RepID=A0A8X8XYY9_SALSN|nr:hypothetical protein SASPL_118211 [Salvia splendens]
MKVKFDKYWGDWSKMNPVIFIANVLDQRNKLKMLQVSAKKLKRFGDYNQEKPLLENNGDGDDTGLGGSGLFDELYPILSLIAKDIFAIQSSTIASESAFILGKRVVDPFRNSLSPTMVEALVYTNDWLKADEFSLYKDPTDDDLAFFIKKLKQAQVTQPLLKRLEMVLHIYLLLIDPPNDEAAMKIIVCKSWDDG